MNSTRRHTTRRRVLDERDAPAFAAALLALRAGYVPEWLPRERGADAAMLQIAAHQLQAVARRLDAGARQERAGVSGPGRGAPRPGAARAGAGRLPARGRRGGRPPARRAPGLPRRRHRAATTQVTYETERSTGLAAAKLRECREPVARARPVHRPQRRARRRTAVPAVPTAASCADTPHVLYLAHDRLLALAGQSAVTVTFELTTAEQRVPRHPLGVLGRQRVARLQGHAARVQQRRRRRSSTAPAACARAGPTGWRPTAPRPRKATVGGVEAYWVRGRLEETLPGRPGPRAARGRRHPAEHRDRALVRRASGRAARTRAAAGGASRRAARALDAAGRAAREASTSVRGRTPDAT